MLETALRSLLIANSDIYTLVGEGIYVSDTPTPYSYPYILISGAGETNRDVQLKDCMIESLAVDIFASHNPEADIYGYPQCAALGKLIREMFDGAYTGRWTDETGTYDITKIEYRSSAYQVSKQLCDLQKPIMLTISYNII